jgi:hypothetical protein
MKKMFITLAVVVAILVIGIIVENRRHSRFLDRVDAECKIEANMKNETVSDATTTKVWFDCMTKKGVKFQR